MTEIFDVIQSPGSSGSRRILVIVPNFPSRVQAFIAQELLSLERLGHELEVHVLQSRGNDPAGTGIAAGITSPVHYPSKNVVRRFLTILTTWSIARRLPGYQAAKHALMTDLRARWSFAPIVNFASALALAQKVNSNTDVLYAQFFKHPACVAHYTSLMTSVPWTCSAHARDIWLASDRDMKVKGNSARWIATCTTLGADRLKRHGVDPDRIFPVYHGVDDISYPPYSRTPSIADGSTNSLQVKLLTVGRIVRKKGFGDLIRALALLPPSINWSLRHVGTGRGTTLLSMQAERLGIRDRVTFVGYRPITELVHEYRNADVFILPCLIDRDGDMDGLPNALAEAASQAMACVTTDVSEIPKLFRNETHALIVPSRDPQSLAQAIERVILDPKLRETLGTHAAKMIRDKFNHRKHLMRLSQLFLELDTKTGIPDAEKTVHGENS